MKTLLRCLAGTLVWPAVLVSAAPDYSGLNQAVTNYFAALDVIVKKLTSVKDAAGTADVVNEWALANEILSRAMEDFLAKNPEIAAQKQPPPELAAAFSRLSRLKTDYAALPENVGRLVQRFGNDSDVTTAMTRFQKSLARVQQAGTLQKKAQ